MIKYLLFLAAVLAVGSRVMKGYEFDKNCGDYLEMAANANTVETAKRRLSTAIDYIEHQRLTQGNTGVFTNRPTNDLGEWYQNLKGAQKQLDELSVNASSLEQSNVLLKLRDTLTDADKQGTHVTKPADISVYPNTAVWFVVLWGGVLMFFTSMFLIRNNY